MEIGPIFRSMRRNKTRVFLVVAEIALTLAVVANCLTLIAEAKKEMSKESGFDDDNIVQVRSMPFEPAFREDGYADNSVVADLDKLRAIPGVKSASNTRFLPWQGGGSSGEVKIAGTSQEKVRTQMYPVDEKMLDTLGINLVDGRFFTREEWLRDTRRLRDLLASERERDASGKVKDQFTQDVVISQAFGKLAFGEGSYLGKMLEDSDGDLYRVIGVVDRFYNPYGWPIHENVMFYATMSRGYEYGTQYLIRTEPGQRDAVAAALESEMLAVNRGREVRIRTLDEIKNGFFASKRVVVGALSGLSLLLVGVTALGIVGLTSFSVAERTRQIGTRRALGARRVDILRYFLLENWALTSCGLAIGVVCAVVLNIGLVNGVAGAKLQPQMVVAGIVFLWMTGLLATAAPAARASRIAPSIATRNV